MRHLLNLARGILHIRVEGPFPERMLNLCAQSRIDFWGLVRVDGQHMELTIHRSDLKKLTDLGKRAGCSVEQAGERGLPGFLLRFRRRYAFLTGLALSLCAVMILSGVIFTVEVTGNEKVPTARILSELRYLGLRPGVYGPGLERKQIAQEALVRLKELSWLTVNLRGTKAEVIVREAVPPPELTKEEGVFDVVARREGVVTAVEAHSGEALVRRGDAVREGDVLISGHVSMRPPIYSDAPVRYFDTCARGSVKGRTLRTLKARIPMTAMVKNYTGRERNLYAVTIFGREIDFYRNSSISAPFYDKITHVFCGGENPGAPFRWKVCRMREYVPGTAEIDRRAARELLERQLAKRLETAVGEDGSVESVRCSAQPVDGSLEVTVRAECREELGRRIPADHSPENAADP